MKEWKYTILVVEDEPLISEMVAKSLKLEGYTVVVAQTGDDGLSKAKEIKPDLVLLDVLLPKLDGWEILTRLRDDPRCKDIPIIMLTALTDEKSKVQGLRGGADDYVTKPFSALELMARVEAVLKRADRAAPRGSTQSQVPVRKGDKIYLIDMDDINFIDVRRDCTYLHTDNDHFLAGNTMTEFENILDPRKFFRAHRGYIVNLRKIREIIKVGTSSFELTMNDPEHSKIPMSRRQTSELKKLLNI